MKTKHVNTEQQITDYKRANKNRTKKEDEELYMKGMMISCFAYGGISKESYNFEKYISKYKEVLGDKLFDEIYLEQKSFLENNYQIDHCVYTDSEGCTYNSLRQV